MAHLKVAMHSHAQVGIGRKKAQASQGVESSGLAYFFIEGGLL